MNRYALVSLSVLAVTLICSISRMQAMENGTPAGQILYKIRVMDGARTAFSPGQSNHPTILIARTDLSPIYRYATDEQDLKTKFLDPANNTHAQTYFVNHVPTKQADQVANFKELILAAPLDLLDRICNKIETALPHHSGLVHFIKKHPVESDNPIIQHEMEELCITYLTEDTDEHYNWFVNEYLRRPDLPATLKEVWHSHLIKILDSHIFYHPNITYEAVEKRLKLRKIEHLLAYLEQQVLPEKDQQALEALQAKIKDKAQEDSAQKTTLAQKQNRQPWLKKIVWIASLITGFTVLSTAALTAYWWLSR